MIKNRAEKSAANWIDRIVFFVRALNMKNRTRKVITGTVAKIAIIVATISIVMMR